MYVEYARAPAGEICAKNASPVRKASSASPPYLDWRASDVTEKSGESVLPVMNALPFASTAMPAARSSLLPPIYDEYTSALPCGLILATNPSPANVAVPLAHDPQALLRLVARPCGARGVDATQVVPWNQY